MFVCRDAERYIHIYSYPNQLNEMPLSCVQEYFGLMTGQKHKYKLGNSMEVCMDIQHSAHSCTVSIQVVCGTTAFSTQLYYTVCIVCTYCM